MSQRPMTPDDHLALFVEFTRRTLAVGGPDPHVKIVANAPVSDLRQRLWLAGCYIDPYTVAGAAVLYATVPITTALSVPQTVHDHFEQIWRGIPMRRERRAVWNVWKFTASLISYAAWVETYADQLSSMSYEEAWDTVGKLRYYGRYARMKLLGTLWWMGLLPEGQTDIRPHGGWSPRRALALIYPDYREVLERNSSKAATINVVNDLAAELKAETELRLDHELDYFRFETLLCNYRQGIGKSGKYIGSSHDSERAYWHQAIQYWGSEDMLLEAIPFWAIRRDTFPHRCLGELMGWPAGTRKELEGTHERHGYLWCDLTYNYAATTDTAEPVRWDD